MSPSRRSLAVALGLVLVAVVVGAAVEQARPASATDDGTAPAAISLFEPEENGSAIWPYTSRARSPETRTLAINVVVHGDPDAVRDALSRRTDADWNQTTDEEAEDADAEAVEAIEIDGTAIEWQPARGAARYTYVAGPEGDGEWVREHYQLHVGDYLGSRHHIRAYAAPTGKWTAMQAHEEYWDWFRLRHTVTGAASAQRFVENDLRDERFVTELRRTWTGDRWLTEVELAALVVLAVGLSWRDLLARARAGREYLTETVEPADVALFGATLGLFLAVRFGGLALERWFPSLSPKVIAGLLYPLLALGLPLVVAAIARWSRPLPAFVAAASGLGTALVLDYGALGIAAVPVSVALHRVAVVVVLGVIAAGAASAPDGEQTTWLSVGALAWLATLALPLLGLL